MPGDFAAGAAEPGGAAGLAGNFTSLKSGIGGMRFGSGPSKGSLPPDVWLLGAAAGGIAGCAGGAIRDDDEAERLTAGSAAVAVVGGIALTPESTDTPPASLAAGASVIPADPLDGAGQLRQRVGRSFRRCGAGQCGRRRL